MKWTGAATYPRIEDLNLPCGHNIRLLPCGRVSQSLRSTKRNVYPLQHTPSRGNPPRPAYGKPPFSARNRRFCSARCRHGHERAPTTCDLRPITSTATPAIGVERFKWTEEHFQYIILRGRTADDIPGRRNVSRALTPGDRGAGYVQTVVVSRHIIYLLYRGYTRCETDKLDRNLTIGVFL